MKMIEKENSTAKGWFGIVAYFHGYVHLGPGNAAQVGNIF